MGSERPVSPAEVTVKGWTEEDSGKLEHLRNQLATSGYAVAANVRCGNFERAKIETERYFELDGQIEELNRKWQDAFHGRYRNRAEP
jgi:hypothetical protein